MAIPEAQLETWSHQGATVTSSATYGSIQAALAAGASPIREMDYEPCLQGSYKNSTNIRGDSDVDVVVQLNSTWGRDLSGLSPDQTRLYQASYYNATYLWSDFRRDVLQALRAYYGPTAVVEGDKSLKVLAGGGRLAADVIPALHFRKYWYFRSIQNKGYIDGIKFSNRRDNREITNFPKPHYENGVSKQAAGRTSSHYKPTVRVFKNARTFLVGQGLLDEDVAPSYFVECFLYNVPDAEYAGTLQQRFVSVWNWL